MSFIKKYCPRGEVVEIRVSTAARRCARNTDGVSLPRGSPPSLIQTELWSLKIEYVIIAASKWMLVINKSSAALQIIYMSTKIINDEWKRSQRLTNEQLKYIRLARSSYFYQLINVTIIKSHKKYKCFTLHIVMIRCEEMKKKHHEQFRATCG